MEMHWALTGKTEPADDIEATELHLVVNKPVKLVINAQDVIHDVGCTFQDENGCRTRHTDYDMSTKIYYC